MINVLRQTLVIVSAIAIILGSGCGAPSAVDSQVAATSVVQQPVTGTESGNSSTRLRGEWEINPVRRRR